MQVYDKYYIRIYDDNWEANVTASETCLSCYFKNIIRDRCMARSSLKAAQNCGTNEFIVFRRVNEN